jgi:hypothetical protein
MSRYIKGGLAVCTVLGIFGIYLINESSREERQPATVPSVVEMQHLNFQKAPSVVYKTGETCEITTLGN